MDVSELVTSKIVDRLEEGVIPWRKTWTSGPAKSLTTGKECSVPLDRDRCIMKGPAPIQGRTTERGAAFLSGACGLDNSARLDDASAYIAGWLRALRDDQKLLLQAANAAQKAKMR